MIAKRRISDPVGTEETRSAWAEPVAADSSTLLDGGESPARMLQQTLASRINDGFALDADGHVERWPRRQRLIFLIGAATALWGVTIGLAMIGYQIVGHLKG